MTVSAPVLPAAATPRRRLRPIWLMVLITIVLILGVLNLILVLLQSAYQPANSASGALLYATRFDNPNAPEWYYYNSAQIAQIADHSLQFTANDADGTIFSPLQFPFRNFDLRVNVRQIQESADDPYSEYGILFRYQNTNNYDVFKVMGDGSYHIQQVINGQATDLSALHMSPSFAPGEGAVNDLRLIARGDHFQFYLNGQLLVLCPKGNDKSATWNGDKCLSNGGQTTTTLIDSTFMDGQIALGLAADQSPVQIAFTDLVILSPQNP